NEAALIEKLLEDVKNNKSDLQIDKRTHIAKSLAQSAALKAGTPLSNEEMAELIDKLFACQSPNISVNGKPTLVTFSLQELMEKIDKIYKYTARVGLFAATQNAFQQAKNTVSRREKYCISQPITTFKKTIHRYAIKP